MDAQRDKTCNQMNERVINSQRSGLFKIMGSNLAVSIYVKPLLVVINALHVIATDKINK